MKTEYRICKNAFGYYKIQETDLKYENYKFWKHEIFRRKRETSVVWTDLGNYDFEVDAVAMVGSLVEQERIKTERLNGDWTCEEGNPI